ncbi:LPXTG cell wall anchor domain-containing protein [Aurantimicrobium minutum]|uniref:LPXTG cell wall anchor domain-containing protein n=1 Tax=Aurantimicrobium minutum TaxID=708131 RepID=UPI00247612E0|nr:LPXTG cell wall anchor domain-containing protein [Aurantimicrobium minutum]MDH6422841.1 LPXTG-motif cell wall-anchored protein [Aurantimicrobium minutum]
MNRTFVIALIAVLSSAMGTIFAATSASATGENILYWVSDEGHTSTGDNRVFSSPITQTLINSPISGNTASTFTSRALATDGTYLYFNDNNNSGSWDIVRTNLDGTNKTVIATGVSEASQLVSNSTFLFYSTWNDGVFAVSKTPGSTPNRIDNISGSGFQGLAVCGTDIYAEVYSDGLYKATSNGTTAVSFTKNTANAGSFNALSVTSLACDSNNLYLGQLQGNGVIYKTPLSSWNANPSTWTQLNISSVTNYSWGIFYFSDSIYFSDSNGKIGSITSTGTSPTLMTTSGSSTWNVAVTAGPTPTPTPSPSNSSNTLPNTGSNGESLIGFAGLLLMGGISLLAYAIIRRRIV